MIRTKRSIKGSTKWHSKYITIGNVFFFKNSEDRIKQIGNFNEMESAKSDAAFLYADNNYK